MFDIALSTMWAIGRFKHLADFFVAAKSLGFGRFELNHAIGPAMLEGLALDGMITSIHEPCPAEPSLDVLKARNWLISAVDEKDRQEGVAAVRRSIDLAAGLGVPVVIVHPGRVDMDPALESTLVRLYNEGLSDQPEYARAKDRFLTARATRAAANMESVRRSVIELAGYAASRGIRLALENRYHAAEIPLPDELEDLLSLGCGETVGYWHDVGHAQVLEHLGFGTHEEWLRRFAARMIGVHLHDVIGVADHRVAGSGRIDWSLVAKYLPAGVLRTCEFQPSNSPDAVAAGVRWLIANGCSRLSPKAFAEILYERMKRLEPAIEDMALYEFRYCLDNLCPENGGWASVEPDGMDVLEQQTTSPDFYVGIQLKPRTGDRIVLDGAIVRLTRMLFVGLVTEKYPEAWIRAHFYFDPRGFLFLHRTRYFTDEVVAHLDGRPFRSFEPKQKRLDRCQAIGYKAFAEANAEVDGAFLETVQALIAAKGMPIVVAIAGPTAAGKTEIVERLRCALEQSGRMVTSIEMDNFLTDRDYREERGIHTLGREAIHLGLLKQSLEAIRRGHAATIPQYDFVTATSSHDLHGRLKEGRDPLVIQPADIVFIEGNFPFLLDEITPLIGLKIMYLTDDPIRMKRKWKRDIDYRKKYDPTYFRNRFFKEQFLMAQACYVPQMKVCDLVVDTTGAALWVTPEISEILGLG